MTERTGNDAREASRADPSSWPLDERPGFLIRRVHQIHVSLFAEACAGFRITPLQYSLLSALSERDGVDQTTLAGLVALDRTTTTGALRRLESRGLVERTKSERDRRSFLCRLTPAGNALLAEIEAPARRAHEETLSVLDAAERVQIIDLLNRIVAAHQGRHQHLEPL